MKKLIVIILGVFACFSSFAQSPQLLDIPDVNFKFALVNYNVVDANGKGVSGRNYILLDYSIHPEQSDVVYEAVPTNDLCENADSIECGLTVYGDTTEATNTDNPGTCDTDLSTAPGVWYTFTMPFDSDYDVTADTFGSNYDTKLGVFFGDCGALICVAGNDNSDGGGLQSEVYFEGIAGETYYIYVTGFESEAGEFVLSVNCEIELATNDNDIDGFSYFPNPVKDVLNIENLNGTKIKIFDILGRLVFQEKNPNNQLDVSKLSSGLLFVKIETDKGIFTKKIIKE